MFNDTGLFIELLRHFENEQHKRKRISGREHKVLLLTKQRKINFLFHK